MITKAFEEWLAEEVEDVFGIEKKESLEVPNEWLEVSVQELDKRIEML